jgi:rhodanese-related sulfurtransferase
MAWDDISQWQPADLYASFRMGDKGVIPVDVRDLTYREADQQIKGSLRIDPMDFQSQLGTLPADVELVFYCDRAGEATSMKIALVAFDGGRSRVGVLVGGFEAWDAAGYPMEPKG